MKKPQNAFIIGIILGAIITRIFLVTTQTHEDTHPIGYADNTDEVHVHSDFIMHLDGETIDFSLDKYQTTNQQTVHQHIHLHDNNGEVIHRHAQAVTLGEFFGSLGFILGTDCITTPDGTEYCTNDKASVAVFVNSEQIEDAPNYVNQEEDRILIYYGALSSDRLPELLNSITDTACIYSGTCPERGVAPPESCGLTCELSS